MNFGELDDSTKAELKKIFKEAFVKTVRDRQQLNQLIDNCIFDVQNAFEGYEYKKRYREYSAKRKNAFVDLRNAITTLINCLSRSDNNLPLGQLAIVLLEDKHNIDGFPVLDGLNKDLKKLAQVVDLVIDLCSNRPKKVAMKGFFEDVCSCLYQYEPKLAKEHLNKLLINVTQTVIPIKDFSPRKPEDGPDIDSMVRHFTKSFTYIAPPVLSIQLTKRYSPEFKMKVALAAISEEMTVSEIATKYNVSPNAILNWKKLIAGNLSTIFEKNMQNRLKGLFTKSELNALYKKLDYCRPNVGID